VLDATVQLEVAEKVRVTVDKSSVKRRAATPAPAKGS
jgi:hypothetical protein